MEKGIDNGATRVAEHVSAAVRREEANYRVGHGPWAGTWVC